jgi:hypothetical protein
MRFPKLLNECDPPFSRTRQSQFNSDSSSFENFTGGRVDCIPLEHCARANPMKLCSLRDHEAEMLEACMKDLGKGYYEAMLTEIKWVENDIIFMCNNLEKWAQDEKPADIDFVNSLMSPRIRKDPLGCVLVIG